jgi:hypothetical protein
MKATRYTASHNGQTFNRSSKAGGYKHLVVALPNIDFAASRLDIKLHAKLDFSNYAYFAAYLDGSSTFLKSCGWRTDAQQATYNADQIARATASLAGATTLAEYLAGQDAKRRAAFAASVAAGAYTQYVVMGWSSRADLARRLAGGLGEFYCKAAILDAIVA